ncbi:transketolase family protein [Streptomyces luteolus]|uniref:Transketolase n=1 Tax=Streptomyces luteolus TaxID=3043615 RepID=A0ABT6SSA7_9ACTN|nr:transketolase [Streptomyces sp. B-S-A12]MDI3418484.1 transketolase [Streptomyces sp. B-S-A12]
MTLSGREAYRAELTRVGYDDERVLCLETPVRGESHPFELAHPERFYALRTTEAAMVDMAAGLAIAGYRPFVSLTGPFQEENLGLVLSYLSVGVTVVSPQRVCPANFKELRRVPGVTVAAPYGEAETRAVTRTAAASGRAHYIRVGCAEEVRSLDWIGSELPLVNWDFRNDRADVCLVSVGVRGTELALAAREAAPRIAHAHLVYLDNAHLARAAAELTGLHRKIVVVGGRPDPDGLVDALAELLPGSEVVGVPTLDRAPAEGIADVLSAVGRLGG